MPDVQVMARRSMTDARGALSVIQETPFPLEGFIQQEPSAAVSVLNSDLEASARLIRDSDPVLFPPARVIYRLIYADPALAARLTIALEGPGATDLVMWMCGGGAFPGLRLQLRWLQQC
jgi:hypothetical protein